MHKCTFCNKTFKRESTIQTHMCEQKRRHFKKNDKDTLAGYSAYIYWSKNNNGGKNQSYDKFAKSRLYTCFVKFGVYIIQNNINDWEKYIDWLSKNQVKVDDWPKDKTYGVYCSYRTEKETAERALERYILFVQKWEENTKYKWHTFWKKNSIFNTIQLLIDGKISPWILFCDPNAKEFIDELPEELLVELDRNLNLEHWKSKVNRNEEDSEWITKMLTL